MIKLNTTTLWYYIVRAIIPIGCSLRTDMRTDGRTDDVKAIYLAEVAWNDKSSSHTYSNHTKRTSRFYINEIAIHPVI